MEAALIGFSFLSGKMEVLDWMALTLKTACDYTVGRKKIEEKCPKTSAAKFKEGGGLK